MEDDSRRKKVEAAKEKLAAYKKRKSSRKNAGKISDSEHSSFSHSDTSLSLSPLPLSENIKKTVQENSESISISENIELSNSENDRSLQEILIANIPKDSPDLSLNSALPEQSQIIHQNSILSSDTSVISLNALERFELENNYFIDNSQNVLAEIIKHDEFDVSKTESIRSNPFDDLSSLTLRSERITGCANRTSPKDVVIELKQEMQEKMPCPEPVAQNSTDVESLKEFNSSNQSTLSLGTSTEYKQYYDKINMGTIEYQNLLTHREEYIKQLTDALQQVVEDRNSLQEQAEHFAQEIADLREQLVETNAIIKRNNWNLSDITVKKPERQEESESTSHKVLNQNNTDINFDFEDPEFNETMSPAEKKIVADMRNKINLYIQQKVVECKHQYETEIKELQAQLGRETNKNTEDSVSTLPSMENNDKFSPDQTDFNKQIVNFDTEFNETFGPDELNIISDIRMKIYTFIQQTLEKYQINHEIELKVLKDRLESEKITHEAEVDRLRQLLVNEISEVRRELNDQHSKEMIELRTYFEQRCSEMEKQYSEEIFSQQSRKMSGSSVSELESDVYPPRIGPCGDVAVVESPKRDIASLRLELQNKYHAELEILREDYENRLDELKINHEKVVQELEQKYQIVINALKLDLQVAQKSAVATQEVASSGDFEIAEVVESYQRRLQEQVMLAKIDIISALEQQIQTLVSSSSDNLEWPSELLQLRDRLTEHWHSEIQEIKQQHAEEISRLKEDHEKNLARALDRERRNSLKSGDEIEVRKERDNLKKITSNLRHLVAELIKYFTKCEDELNNTLVEELLKCGFDRDVSDLNESSQSGSEHLDTISPIVKRVHFTPDVTGIINLINETTLENLDTTKDISSEFRTELDLCLSRLKSEATAILALTSNLKTKPLEMDDSKLSTEDKVSSLTRHLISETQVKNELNMQLEESKDYIKNLELEKQSLEFQLEQIMAKQQVLISELDNAKEKINDLIESGRKEIISEGYGENQITGSTTLGGRIASLAELQARARSILAETDGSSRHPLLQLIEELCREGDRIMEDAKKDHEDLAQQIEAADKKLRATTQFLEDQAIERELERDEAQKEINALKEQLREKDRTRASCERVNKEESQGFKLNACNSDFSNTVVETVERLEVQMREMTVLMNECEAKKTEVENELKEAIDKIWVLRDIVRDLESQIENKNKIEVELKNIVTQLEDKISFELKENEDLRNKFILLETCPKEAQYQEVIRQLESENQKLKVSSELVGPEGVLKQVKTQLNEFEKTLEKRTKDLESLHIAVSNTNCSSPSEDMSIRDQIRPPSSNDGDTDLPLEQLARLKDKLIRHARAEDAAMKRIRDLEMQLYTSKQEYDEMQSERDILQEQLSEQLVIISSLQLRLDEQRLRVESVQKQSNASFEHKIYELNNEIQELKDTIHNRDTVIKDLNVVVEETKKRITEQQKQLSSASDIEKQLLDQFESEINRLESENKALNLKIQDCMSSSRSGIGLTSTESQTVSTFSGDIMESLLADKNADIDGLKSKLNSIEEKLKFYASLNLSQEQLIEFSNCISKCKSETKSDITSLIDSSDLDPLRRQEQSFESITSSGENFDVKRNVNETVFIGSTFRESKHADKLHSPFVASEISTIEKVGPPCVDFTSELIPSMKASGDSASDKHVHFEDFSNYQSKLVELEEELKIKDQSIKEYERNLEEIHKKLEFSYESIREKTDHFVDEIEAMKEERRDLQVELAEAKMKLQERDAKLEAIEKDVERKDKMYMNLAKEKRDLENMVQELKDRIGEFKDYEMMMTEKNKEIFSLEQQLVEAQSFASTESLKESILQKESEINLLKEQVNNLESNLQEKFKEIEKNYMNFEKIQEELSDKNQLISNLEEEHKHILEENLGKINEYEDKISNLQKDLEEYKSNVEDKTTINKLELDIAKSKIEITERDIKLSENKTLIEELNKEVHHLQEYLNEKDKIIHQMTEDSNSLHVALEAIQSKIQESGNVVDLKKRLREEQNLTSALYEELKYLKQSIERYESAESLNAIEKKKVISQELSNEKDALIEELDRLHVRLRAEEDNVQRYKQLLHEEKLNSNMVQIQDANIIESMRLRLEALLEHEKSEEETVKKLRRLLEEEKINTNMIHMRDANIIESLKIRIDELLKREHEFEKLLKIEKRVREEMEEKLAMLNLEHRTKQQVKLVSSADAEAGHLFGKYLKSESYRKALVFQKRYLLTLLASHQNCSVNQAELNFVLPKTSSYKPLNKFRAAVYAVISISRMQYIVRRWHTGKRIGGSVITRKTFIPTTSTGRPTDNRPWVGNSPPCKDRKRQDLPLGDAIQESMTLAPLQAPALLSQYIERFDSIQQRLGLAIDRSGT